MGFLEVNHIVKQEKVNLVVNNISFIQERVQKTAIAGATGSGKTTLLKMIAGLIQPDAGEILFENKRVLGPYEKLIPGHPQIAYLSQHFELRTNYKVSEALEMANQLTDEEAQTIYSVCRIGHLLHHRTDELSGGEKQRVALAIQLSTAPKILLLDEPFSNLDAVHKNIIKSVLHDITKRLQLSCIMVSHDALDILSWADRIMIMKDGKIIQEATPLQLYHQPIDTYCAGLLGEYNLIDSLQYALFSNNENIVSENKKVFIRPEQFIIETDSDKGVEGIVQQVLFFGSYYIIEVLVNKQILIVKTRNTNYFKRDTIYLSFSMQNLWYL